AKLRRKTETAKQSERKQCAKRCKATRAGRENSLRRREKRSGQTRKTVWAERKNYLPRPSKEIGEGGFIAL
ncbi:MAG: hypothetical protein KBS47_00110, partial [Bacteroidales bacterium]|nr:hypothetical protein [Candidatus Equimonas enterica]